MMAGIVNDAGHHNHKIRRKTMSLLESIDIPIGTQITPFELPDPDGKTYKSDNLFGSKGLIVSFTCNHCPYAIACGAR